MSTSPVEITAIAGTVWIDAGMTSDLSMQTIDLQGEGVLTLEFALPAVPSSGKGLTAIADESADVGVTVTADHQKVTLTGTKLTTNVQDTVAIWCGGSDDQSDPTDWVFSWR